MTAIRSLRCTAVAVAFLACAADLGAQAALDRNVTPPPGKATTFRVPTWTHTKLANGAELVVTEKHDLPLVAFSISFIGGATSFEPADRLGVASFTAQMLSEGTPTRTADQLSDAQQLLGTTINANVVNEAGSIGF